MSCMILVLVLVPLNSGRESGGNVVSIKFQRKFWQKKRATAKKSNCNFINGRLRSMRLIFFHKKEKYIKLCFLFAMTKRESKRWRIWFISVGAVIMEHQNNCMTDEPTQREGDTGPKRKQTRKGHKAQRPCRGHRKKLEQMSLWYLLLWKMSF